MAWNWNSIGRIGAKAFTCGHCGLRVGPNEGYYANMQGTGQRRYIYICSNCEHPTYFDGDAQIPGALFGSDVAKLPKDVGPLYNEARRS